MVDELLVTVTLAFIIVSVVGSPRAESAIAIPSSAIVAVTLLRFTPMSPSQFVAARLPATRRTLTRPSEKSKPAV